MSIEQAGNQVRVRINGLLYPADARAAADELNRVAGVIEAAVPNASAAAIAADIQAAVASLPDNQSGNTRQAILRAVASYLAQAGYKKPAAGP